MLPSPLKYSYIRDEAGKLIILPRLLSAFALGLVITLSLLHFNIFNVYGESGLIDRIGSFVSTLTGFYVAALVAVATFGPDKAEMDGPMTSGKLHVLQGGEKEELCRREYLTALYGYLVTISFAISISSIFLTIAADALDPITGSFTVSDIKLSYQTIVFAVSTWSYFTLLIHLVSETSGGLHYLVDKIYRTKPRIVPGSLKSKKANED